MFDNSVLQTKDISASLGVLSSMLTPAVLIMVCGSLILGTSNRLTRLIDRTRKLYDQHKVAVKKGDDTVAELLEEREALKKLLPLMITRVRFLQIALTSLYMALAFFVFTSILIGVFEVAGFQFSWVPLGIGMIGAGFLFHSTLMLISETRIGFRAVYFEMNIIADFIRPADTHPRHRRRWF